MLAEGIRECAAVADMFKNPVTAPKREWNRFAEMAEDDFQPWKGVKYTADNQTDGMDGSLSSETPRYRQNGKSPRR